MLLLSVFFTHFNQWETRLYRLLINSQVLKSADVVIIDIDHDSLQEMGRYPFSHQIYQQVIAKLSDAQLIINTLSWPQLENRESITALQNLQKIYSDPNSDATLMSLKPNDLKTSQLPNSSEINWIQLLQKTQQQLDHSQTLANLLNKTVLAIPVQLSPINQRYNLHNHHLLGFNAKAVSTLVQNQRLRQVISNFSDQDQTPRFVQALKPPHDLFIAKAKAVTWLPMNIKEDGNIPLDFPLVLQYKAYYYPSLALTVSTLLNNKKPADIQITLGKQIQVSQTIINTDSHLQARSTLSAVIVPKIAFIDIYKNKINAATFKDKWVVLALNQQHQQTAYISTDELVKQIISIQQHQLASFNTSAYLLDYLLLTLYILLFIKFGSLLKIWVIGASVILFSAIQIGLMSHLLITYQQWWALSSSLLFLWIALFIYGLQQIFICKYTKKQALNNTQDRRMLGLTYQSQGKLDLAFNQWRQCRIDNRLLGLFYNLAMDYEQRKQPAQALAVYQHMQIHSPDYRDIEQRLLRIQEALNEQNSKTLNAKVQNRQHLNDLLNSNSQSHKPMLGNFQIEKCLGRGAMGVLYLGKDRKFNRMVALKTIALSDEFEGKELEDVTARFFREAEAVSRLTHKHIISVYHAGEENQLAYIAMEFFKGSNLIPYTNPDNLLTLMELLSLMINIADALAYAHEQGVIHRDVKPGNIMYNQGTGSLKLTDFGIARIPDQHKTRTGIILGTPSYMAPEQLAGNEIDGRADLFSLGVMLFQLLTGQLPFKAASMASLMFQIAHSAPTNILKLRPQLPNCLRLLVNTLLEKQPERRYHSGYALVKALQSCQQQIEKQDIKSKK